MLSPAVAEQVGTPILATQGWMCCQSGRAHLHTAGVAGPDQRYLVVVLSRVPRAARWDAARASGLCGAALAAVHELM